MTVYIFGSHSQGEIPKRPFKQLFLSFYFLKFFDHDGTGAASSVADGRHAFLPFLEGVGKVKGDSGT
jgi:hypothetical protein